MAQPSFISAALNAQLEKRKDDAKNKLKLTIGSEINKLVDDLFGIFTGEFNRQVQEAISAVNEVALSGIDGTAQVDPKPTKASRGHVSENKRGGSAIIKQTVHQAPGTSSDVPEEIKQEITDDDSILSIEEVQQPPRKKSRKRKRNGQQSLPTTSQQLDRPVAVIPQVMAIVPEVDEEAIELSQLDDDCNCPDCVGYGSPKEEPNDDGEPAPAYPNQFAQQFRLYQAAESTSNAAGTSKGCFRVETLFVKCVVTDCLETFPNRARRNEHLASVHKLPARFCYLSGCGKWLPKTIKMGDHVATEHGTLEAFPCLGCDHIATTFEQLSQHYNRHHVEGFFRCRATEDCTFTGHFRNELMKHQCAVHYTAPRKTSSNNQTLPSF